MTDKVWVRVRLQSARDRVGGTLMVILLIGLAVLALVSFLGFALVPFFFFLGGTINH